MIGLRDWKVDLRAVSQELSALSSDPPAEERHYISGRISALLRTGDDTTLTTRKMTRMAKTIERNEDNTLSAPLWPDDARLMERTQEEEEDDGEGWEGR